MKKIGKKCLKFYSLVQNAKIIFENQPTKECLLLKNMLILATDESTDAIKPPLSPCPSSVISNTPSTSTTSSISLLRKRIKEKYRNENLRHVGKFRIRNVPKHQSRNQMSDKLFLVKNRLRTPVKY